MELYSDSNRKLEKNDIFIYDEVSEKFKNELFYFIRDSIEAVKLVQIYKKITIEHGINRDINDTYLNNLDVFLDNFINGFKSLVEQQDCVEFSLDLMALFLNEVGESKSKIIIALNKILRKHSMGYQIDEIKNQIIRIDSMHIYSETTKKVLLLLSDEKFENVDDEYRKAYDEYKNANYEGVLVEASKSFESCMKIICELKGYGLPKKSTVSALISHLRSKNFIENFQDEKFNGLDKTLQSSAILRNNQAGHGQGSQRRALSSMYAEYALQVTASNIILLVGIYNESI